MPQRAGTVCGGASSARVYQNASARSAKEDINVSQLFLTMAEKALALSATTQ